MKLRSPKTLVLCEGKDDELVMQSLANHARVGENLVFKEYGGESRLRSFLLTLKKQVEFANGQYAKILITRDADQNYQAAVHSLRDAIQEVFSANVETPGEWVNLASGGLVTSWVIPGPEKTGMIETLCLDAARTKNPDQFNCLDSFIDCLGAQWSQRPHEKIRFTLWTIIARGKLAQDRLSLEYALKNLDFNWDDAAYDGLKELFRSLE